MTEENMKMERKKDNQRREYYEKIKTAGDKFITPEANKIIAQMKKAEEEEDAKAQFYYEEKNRRAIEREKNEQESRKNEKLELQKYLDMQIQERKKELKIPLLE